MNALLAEALFGPGSTARDHVLGVVFIVVAVCGFWFAGWVILQLMRGSGRWTERAIERTFAVIEGTPLRSDEGPTVSVEFTVYTLFLLWGFQRTVKAELPQKRALALVWRLLRHNLCWGWLGPGGVFVPFLTMAEYRRQKRAIGRRVEGVRGEG